LTLSPGKQFEKDFKDSVKKDKIFFYRIKDSTSAFNPKCMECPESKTKFTTKNDCDAFLYKEKILLPLELKSTKSKSLSLSEKIIKPQQIKKLTEWIEYKGVVPGFIINFRESDNSTYFLHINDFNNYVKNLNKKNKSSVPISYCKENGICIMSKIKIINFKYDINKFIEDINIKYFSHQT
jgi:penicillin-binding protein-related factor A (putative recombinase)